MEVFKEIYDSVSQRFKSPFYGYILVSFLLVNWKPTYYLLFSGESALMKFSFFDQNTGWVSLYILPLFIGVSAALIAPFIANFGSWWSSKPTNSRRLREVNFAHEVQRAKNMLAAERENAKASHEQSLIDQAKRDEEIASIQNSELRDELRAKVENEREEVEEDSDNLNDYMSPRPAFSKETYEILEFAEKSPSGKFILFFLPLGVQQSGMFNGFFARVDFPDKNENLHTIRLSRKELVYLQEDISILLERDFLSVSSNDVELQTEEIRYQGIEYQITAKGYRFIDDASIAF